MLPGLLWVVMDPHDAFFGVDAQRAHGALMLEAVEIHGGIVDHAVVDLKSARQLADKRKIQHAVSRRKRLQKVNRYVFWKRSIVENVGVK